MRAINKTKTASMSRVTHLVLAMVSAMTIWHGAAMADSAAPALSSTETSTPAAVPPFAASKQVAAIWPNPSNSNLTMYWWSDGSYSDWSNPMQKFVGHYVGQSSYFHGRGWPANKRVVAIWPNPVVADYTIYWWSDGSRSDWSSAQTAFAAHENNQGSWFNGKGWPANKQVAAIAPSPDDRDVTLYWWTDGGVSKWRNSTTQFVSHSPNQTKWFDDRGWPAGKRVAAIVNGPAAGYTYYWWTDGGVSMWKDATNQFEVHYPNQTKWFDDRGWPIVSFDPLIHKVKDIKVNDGVPTGTIYANGRMQYKVVVRAQIVDKASGKGVDFSDRGTGRNQADQVRDLVTLYIAGRPVDTPGRNLKIDNVGDDNASITWTASRIETDYEKSIASLGRHSEQIDGTVVGHDQEDDNAYPASDGWQSYVYWLSSTKATTNNTPLQFCARIGSYGGYLDSCGGDLLRFAQVRAREPRKFRADDYDILVLPDLSGGDRLQSYTLKAVGLKHGRIRGALISSAPPGASLPTANGGCVARYNRALVGGAWSNNNSSLTMIPFGASSYQINALRIWDIGGSSQILENIYLLPALQTDRINLIQAKGKLQQNGLGIWTNCTDFAPATDIEMFGSIQFIDSFGNSGELTFERTSDDEYVIK